MSKIISLRLTDTEYAHLKSLAQGSNTTVTGFIHDKIFPTSPNLLTVERILQRLDECINSGIINVNSEFTLRDLFDPSEYAGYFNVIPIGKTFAQLAIEPKTQVFKKVYLFNGTKPAKYRIK